MVSSQSNSQTKSEYIRILHRLNEALNLGTRNGKEWQCSDIQIQRHILRLINTLLDLNAIPSNILFLPDHKATISDTVSALGYILEHTNPITLGNTVDTAVKLVTVLPKSILKSHALGLIIPLWSLISRGHQNQLALSCLKALNITLSIPGLNSEKASWNVVKEKGIVSYGVSIVNSFTEGKNPDEYFLLMVSLLSTILRRWPQSRFTVWSDGNLIRKLINDVLVNPDSQCKVEVLKLLSAIAYCGSGATKLLENGESLLGTVVKCMGNSQPHSVQIEAFKLARILAINEERFSKMMSLCCEPMVKPIVYAMTKARAKLREVSSAETSVAVEACRLALIITRWSGDHHGFFWKHGIGDVLHNLLHEDLLPISLEGTNSNAILVFRNYVWDILGWLAIHCKKGFEPQENRQRISVNKLITSACYAYTNIFDRQSKLYQINIDNFPESESAMRAILMMIYSPCTFISSKISSILSDTLKENAKCVLEHITSTLRDMSSRTNFNRRQVIVYVLALACHIGLPDSRTSLHQFSVLRVLLTLVRWCLSNSGFDSRKSNGQTCCDVQSEDWEGKDMILFYSLWGLSEYIKDFERIQNDLDVYSGGIKYSVPELAETLEEICVKVSAPGVRWFAAYGLSSLGLYGFPSKLDKRVKKVLSETGLSDTKLVLKTGESLSAHGVILAIRCPPLLRFSDEANESMEMGEKFCREIRLSGLVDHRVLVKFLDFVYLGYLRAEKEQVRLLKALAKGCNLKSLSHLLSRRRPIWGEPLPGCDLSLALGPLGHQFSDAIFESKENELPSWKCDFCSASKPHIHVHKIILGSSNCDYLYALVNSGMKESHSPSIKLDLSWEAMAKLVTWLYTDKLPNISSGCLWENSSLEYKLHEVEMYLELFRLSEFWCCDDLTEACSSTITSILNSERQLCLKIMKLAVDFSMWKLVETSLAYVAPLYRQLHDSGELENLDEALVNVIRSASVHYTQEGICN